jgi:hypothetical protein
MNYRMQGYLAHKKHPPPLGPPYYRATVGSYGGGGSYERGTPVGAGVCDGEASVADE